MFQAYLLYILSWSRNQLFLQEALAPLMQLVFEYAMLVLGAQFGFLMKSHFRLPSSDI